MTNTNKLIKEKIVARKFYVTNSKTKDGKCWLYYKDIDWLIELFNEVAIGLLEDIKKQYAESYERIAEELQTTREVPNTAFHVIIDQQLNKLKSMLGEQ